MTFADKKTGSFSGEEEHEDVPKADGEGRGLRFQGHSLTSLNDEVFAPRRLSTENECSTTDLFGSDFNSFEIKLTIPSRAARSVFK